MEAMKLLLIPMGCGILALLITTFIGFDVLKKDEGNGKMKEISKHIEEGAMAFLKKEYSYLLVFIVAVFALIAIFLNIKTAVSFIFGSAFSIIAGYCGMRIAVKANVRTAQAAKKA